MTLPGMDAGRRKERTEWGLRHVREGYLRHKGEVVPRVDAEQARRCLGDLYSGFAGTELVKRTVVTYTSDWETVDAVLDQGGDTR